MKSVTTIALLLGALLGPVAAHADERHSDRKHPITFVKDSIITTKVKAMLADEKMGSLVHVKVDTDQNGIVVLSGHVRSEQQKGKATTITAAVKGVTEVRNELSIKADD